MDFVVAGFGLGAVLMLVGFAVRDLGPLRFRSRQDDDTAQEWSELCRRVGTTIVTGGLALSLVTLVLLLVGVSDDTGAVVVVGVAAVAVIGSAVASLLVIREFTEGQRARRPVFAGNFDVESIGPISRSSRPSVRSLRRAPVVETEAAQVPEVDVILPVDQTVQVAHVGPVAQVEPVVQAAPETAPIPAEEVREETPEALAGPVLEETTVLPRGGGIFVSSMLSDVETDAPVENGNGFRSSILANLATSGDHGSYSSSVFADLTEGAVAGPPLPEPAGRADAKEAEPKQTETTTPSPRVSAGDAAPPVAAEGAKKSEGEAAKGDRLDAIRVSRLAP